MQRDRRFVDVASFMGRRATGVDATALASALLSPGASQEAKRDIAAFIENAGKQSAPKAKVIDVRKGRPEEIKPKPAQAATPPAPAPSRRRAGATSRWGSYDVPMSEGEKRAREHAFAAHQAWTREGRPDDGTLPNSAGLRGVPPKTEGMLTALMRKQVKR